MPEAAAAELVVPELAATFGGFDAAAVAGADFAGAGAAEAGLGAVSGVEAVNAAAPGSITKGLTDAEVAGSAFAPAGAAGGATAAAGTGDAGSGGAAGGASMLNASSPLTALDPTTAAALGITDATLPVGTGISGAVEAGSASGFAPGGADTGIFVPGTDYSIYTGGTPTDVPNPMADAVGGGAEAGGASSIDKATEALKKLGLTPATAAMLGISGFQAFSTPEIPAAAKKLQAGAGPGADAASSVIQSGGTSSPSWGAQKSSIDATIDQQIREQSAAMLQQAQNSGQGADSQVTLQQINKLKTDLETKRQQLYAQAQAQNVQVAVQSLGISDQALAQVAQAQFAESNQAKSSASETAKMALMIQAMSGKAA